MTPQDLAKQAERRIDDVGGILSDTPTDEETNFVLDTARNFLNDISGEVALIGDATFNSATAGTWINCPADWIQAYTDDDLNYVITKDGVDYVGFPEFRLLGLTAQIKFPDSGTFVVKYEQAPAKPATITTVLNLHPLLEEVGAIFMAWKYLEKEHSDSTPADQSVTAVNLANEYQAKKAQKLAQLSNPSGQPRQVRVVF